MASERALLCARNHRGRRTGHTAAAAKVFAGLAAGPGSARPGCGEIERDLLAWLRWNDMPRGLQRSRESGRWAPQRLRPLSPTRISFAPAEQFAAWLGLTPLQNSSGGKERLGRISKMGDKYLRRLLVVGMTSLIRRAKYKPESVDPWLRRPPVAQAGSRRGLALANKAARVIWAIMVRGGVYRAGQVPALTASIARRRT